MKIDTIIYHRGIIEKIIAHIEKNILQKSELSVAALAEIAHICPKHTCRIFKAGTGQSLGNYIHRTRMEKAKELLLSKVTVTETSEKLEYENLPAFTAEYRKYFGYPPSQEKNASMDHYKPSKTTKIMNLNERIVNLSPTPVIFVQTIGSYNSNAPEKAWNTLWDFVEKKNLDVEKAGFFGVVHDDTEVTKASQCRYDACISISQEIPGSGPVTKKMLLGGKYAVFTHKGAYKTLDSTYDQIFGPWLASTKEQLEDRPVLEKYLNDPFDTKAGDLVTEIYVPIV
jgi:AraC family transcriptional regulator